MQITFDPFDDIEVSTVQKIIAAVAGKPIKQPDTVVIDAATPIDGVLDAPVEALATTSPPTTTDETDAHGMLWDEAIHSPARTKNNDGSWRAKKGCKKEYDAAVAAHKAAQVANAGEAMVSDQAPVGTAVPMPGMPAAPAPQTPPEPISYEDMARRFTGMMESQAITDYEAVYRDLEIDYTQLETNQTMIARLWQYMDAISQGDVSHRSAISMVMPDAAD